MNIILIMDFSSVISLLFQRYFSTFPMEQRNKIKIHNCVIGGFLCIKYDVAKISFDARRVSCEKTFVTSHFHVLRCITLPIATDAYFTPIFNCMHWLAVLLLRLSSGECICPCTQFIGPTCTKQQKMN